MMLFGLCRTSVDLSTLLDLGLVEALPSDVDTFWLLSGVGGDLSTGSSSERGIPGTISQHNVVCLGLHSTRTAELIVRALITVQTTENATVQQQPDHNLISALPQQSQNIGPRSLFEGGDMVIGVLEHYSGDAAGHGSDIAVHELSGRRALKAMSQEMLRLLIGQTSAVEQGCYDKVHYLV